MTLHQTRGCPFAHRARIVLEEKALPYEVVYFAPEVRPAALEALGPDAKSPTLFDDDPEARVWDSLVVIEYLDERYPAVPLMPTDAAGRARARLLMRAADASLGPAMWPIVQELVFKPAAARDDAKVQAGVARFREALLPWQARLVDQRFLIGDTLTLADVALFTPLASISKILGPAGELPDALATLRAWRDRLAARPSTAY